MLKYNNFMLFFCKIFGVSLINTYISGMTYFVSKTTHLNAQFLYHYIDIIIRTIYGDAAVIGLISKKLNVKQTFNTFKHISFNP